MFVHQQYRSHIRRWQLHLVSKSRSKHYHISPYKGKLNPLLWNQIGNRPNNYIIQWWIICVMNRIFLINARISNAHKCSVCLWCSGQVLFVLCWSFISVDMPGELSFPHAVLSNYRAVFVEQNANNIFKNILKCGIGSQMSIEAEMCLNGQKKC